MDQDKEQEQEQEEHHEQKQEQPSKRVKRFVYLNDKAREGALCGIPNEIWKIILEYVLSSMEYNFWPFCRIQRTCKKFRVITNDIFNSKSLGWCIAQLIRMRVIYYIGFKAENGREIRIRHNKDKTTTVEFKEQNGDTLAGDTKDRAIEHLFGKVQEQHTAYKHVKLANYQHKCSYTLFEANALGMDALCNGIIKIYNDFKDTVESNGLCIGITKEPRWVNAQLDLDREFVKFLRTLISPTNLRARESVSYAGDFYHIDVTNMLKGTKLTKFKCLATLCSFVDPDIRLY